MRIFRYVIFSALLILFSISIFLVLSYLKWEREFPNTENISCFEDVDIDSKIEDFVLSDSMVEFVVFDITESVYILKNNLESSQYLSVGDVCVLPSKGVWRIYVRYQGDGFSVPWLGIDVVKDERETAELYIRDIWVGGYKVTGFLGRDMINGINRGISDAILIVNENSFLGRRITNIELLEERVVVKGYRD